MAKVTTNLPIDSDDQAQADALLADLTALTGQANQAAVLQAAGDMARDHLLGRIKLSKRAAADRDVDARLGRKTKANAANAASGGGAAAGGQASK